MSCYSPKAKRIRLRRENTDNNSIRSFPCPIDDDISANICRICHYCLTSKCVTCRIGTTSNEFCSRVTGACCHIYHKHCIQNMCKESLVCPIDMQKWTIKFMEPTPPGWVSWFEWPNYKQNYEAESVDMDLE